MATAEPKALNPSYIVTEKSDLNGFQVLVNRYIEKGYVPYGPLNYIAISGDNGAFKYQQVMIDPLVLERQQTTIRGITKGAIVSTVTIPGTVNVSGC